MKGLVPMLPRMIAIARRCLPLIAIAVCAGLGNRFGYSDSEEPASPSAVSKPATVKLPFGNTMSLPNLSATYIELQEAQTVEISTRIVSPSQLPDNARVRVSWKLVNAEDPNLVPREPGSEEQQPRPLNAVGIYTSPTPNWSKLLHALDADVYVIYRAPVAGTYALTAAAEQGAVKLFGGTRWSEAGKVAEVAEAPSVVKWPKNANVNVAVSIREIDIAPQPGQTQFVETEPNDTPEQAQRIPIVKTAEEVVLQIVGGSDDVEYFDNARVGSSGDDWYRLEFEGTEPRLLTACLSIPDQQVAARIRCYAVEAKSARLQPNRLLPINSEYTGGKNPNERFHQQNDQHRIAINRNVKPGHVYFLRVEANAPGYDLEIRVVRPAPFEDPRRAIRHALYDHLGQVDAWLMNRPRGASVERRIRDTGNLLGTSCMSCHTQSGVWGPAIPIAQGYRPQNVQLFRNLINICYQSMRPTNQLIDAANNTSLSPLDLGDGPAGTRVAGHSIVSLEGVRPARKLQSKQAIRAANFVLQSGDPGGINAAGPGANVGKGVVFNYAGEIVWAAWKATGDPKYFRALEDKARKILSVDPKYTDDMCHRVEFLSRYVPKDYPQAAAEVALQEQKRPHQTSRVPYKGKQTTPEEAGKLWERIQAQIKADLARLRAVQNPDGSWGFNPGDSGDGGKTWKVTGNNKPEPSPTALALIAFEAAGLGPDDLAVAKGIKALLRLQFPSGLWKGKSQTGFVSTGYALHALSRLFPIEPPVLTRKQFEPKRDETLLESISRVRRLSVAEDPNLVPLMVEAAGHSSPLVRYWAMIGLGGTHTDAGVKPLARGLGDPVKMVREAAHWGLRQTLIDDRGWEAVLAAAKSKDDYTRAAAMRALIMRVDGVLPGLSTDWKTLTGVLAAGMNDDPHPEVRAWAMRAAWQWWIWNPPVRKAINEAWIAMLCREEPNQLVENGMRYQSHALFVANGHKANGSKQHQYKQLGELFLDLHGTLEDAAEQDAELEVRLARRLVGIAATFYNTAGGDGGPGQMGYVTAGSGDLFGDAVMAYFKHIETDAQQTNNLSVLQVVLEGSSNIPHKILQQKLIDYSLHGPEELRAVAANSVSDPRSAQLVAVPELIGPLMQQVRRGANEPPRRKQLSDPLLTLFGRVRWVVPKNLEQQREILGYLVPKFGKYYSNEELKHIANPAQRQQLERKMDADWYIATGLGDAIGKNPDLQFDTVLEFIPTSFQNALVARFWLPSVTWILTHKTQLPDVKVDPGKVPPADPLEEMRSRVLRLFLDQLSQNADLRTRELAVKMAQATALRRNPEVLTALEQLLTFEKRKQVLKTAKNVISTGRKNFLKELAEAVKNEKPVRFSLPDAKPQPPQQFIDDFTYFRDYVTPEMNRVLRRDQRSCFACHGVPSRVPPLTLHRPDNAGYLPVDKLLANYRLLQDRVDLKNVEKSKLLRKPLNVQSAQEDGHQGGRRYQPNDPGYLIIRKWVLNQLEQHDKLGGRFREFRNDR